MSSSRSTAGMLASATTGVAAWSTPSLAQHACVNSSRPRAPWLLSASSSSAPTEIDTSRGVCQERGREQWVAGQGGESAIGLDPSVHVRPTPSHVEAPLVLPQHEDVHAVALDGQVRTRGRMRHLATYEVRAGGVRGAARHAHDMTNTDTGRGERQDTYALHRLRCVSTSGPACRLTGSGMASEERARGGPIRVGVAVLPPLPASSPPLCASVSRSSLLSTSGAAMMASVMDLVGEGRTLLGASRGGSARPPRARSARSAFSPSPHMA